MASGVVLLFLLFYAIFCFIRAAADHRFQRLPQFWQMQTVTKRWRTV